MEFRILNLWQYSKEFDEAKIPIKQHDFLQFLCISFFSS
jgi:hypothetical protein